MGNTTEAGLSGAGQAPRPLTFGERAVGITFNPSGDSKVQEVKELYAKIIDLLNDLRNNALTPPPVGKPTEQARLASIAITEAQGAQMWAVKTVTWKD